MIRRKDTAIGLAFSFASEAEILAPKEMTFVRKTMRYAEQHIPASQRERLKTSLSALHQEAIKTRTESRNVCRLIGSAPDREITLAGREMRAQAGKVCGLADTIAAMYERPGTTGHQVLNGLIAALRT